MFFILWNFLKVNLHNWLHFKAGEEKYENYSVALGLIIASIVLQVGIILNKYIFHLRVSIEFSIYWLDRLIWSNTILIKQSILSIIFLWQLTKALFLKKHFFFLQQLPEIVSFFRGRIKIYYIYKKNLPPLSNKLMEKS